ncbi:uncharacterized protein LOC105897472 [Clupea harengus]|uniref:Uncharacterized protein LOC105897472 n=1 Tax=Clupea harengus TaxID=7950 RepID=A0A6P8F3T6_CLUHA|nr:uncharacterized protein LOC105897472 [Clupea harengus]
MTVAGAVELDQEISVTVALGTQASIHCTYGTGCWGYIHWYQKKEEESFKRILGGSRGTGSEDQCNCSTGDTGLNTLHIWNRVQDYIHWYQKKEEESFKRILQGHESRAMGPQLAFVTVLLHTGFTSGQVTHPKIWTLARTGRTARIDCVVDASDGSFSLSSTALHWYKWKDGEAPTRLLHFPAGSNSAQKEEGMAGTKITADKKGQKSTLTISASSAADRANYCCAVWRSDDTCFTVGNVKVFGSGTRLYVSDDAVRQPTVSVYSSTKSQKENTFLCHASNMFPDLVRFHWKVFKAGKWENVVKNDREVLETSFSDKTNTSIMIIDKQKAGGNRYACSYTHEALREGKESKPLEIEGKKGGQTEPVTKPQAKTFNVTVCSTPNDTAISTLHQLDEYFGAARSLYLATWVYTLMIFKSTVYFCAISYFICTKNMRSKRSLNRRAP